jgi:hypothetical protein
MCHAAKSNAYIKSCIRGIAAVNRSMARTTDERRLMIMRTSGLDPAAGVTSDVGT